MVDRVRPLKLEDTGTGGSTTDQFPSSLNKNEDYVDARGVTIQNASSNDDTVRIERTGNDLVFVDPNGGSRTLTQVAAGASDTGARALNWMGW